MPWFRAMTTADKVMNTHSVSEVRDGCFNSDCAVIMSICVVIGDRSGYDILSIAGGPLATSATDNVVEYSSDVTC